MLRSILCPNIQGAGENFSNEPKATITSNSNDSNSNNCCSISSSSSSNNDSSESSDTNSVNSIISNSSSASTISSINSSIQSDEQTLKIIPVKKSNLKSVAKYQCDNGQNYSPPPKKRKKESNVYKFTVRDP